MSKKYANITFRCEPEEKEAFCKIPKKQRNKSLKVALKSIINLYNNESNNH